MGAFLVYHDCNDISDMIIHQNLILHVVLKVLSCDKASESGAACKCQCLVILIKQHGHRLVESLLNTVYHELSHKIVDII